MEPDSKKYVGREQSYIKHQFLTKYLQAAAYKTFQGRSATFNFVDAFAGPWKVSDENLSDASFDQALRTLEAVRSDLGKKGAAGLKVRFCFCEKRAEAISRLEAYAAKRTNFDIAVFHGAFEDNLAKISDKCRDGFTFTFIDPTGWNIRSEPVIEFLRVQEGEFLLNFMAEHVNRHAEYAQVSASFGRFLADPNWVDEFNQLPPNWSNERRVLQLFKNRMRVSGAATYLPDFPILKPTQQRVKMRLVLGTHSAKGLEVFRDVQHKVERREIETRNSIKNETSKQVSLFTDEEVSALEQNSAGIGCPHFQAEAELIIKDILNRGALSNFDKIASEVLELVPIRLTQLKALMLRLKECGDINFTLPDRKRVPQRETIIEINR